MIKTKKFIYAFYSENSGSIYISCALEPEFDINVSLSCFKVINFLFIAKLEIWHF